MRKSQENGQQKAIKRSQFLKNLRITVKASAKTLDQDQLIVIETTNMTTNQNVEIVMRKLTELDYLVEHINKEVGGHVIPFLKSDLYFQKNLQIEKLVPIIAEYFNDLKQNKYCRQDAKVYGFLLEQSMTIPPQFTYDKMLRNASDFSRKYLSSIFLRKQIPKQENTGQLLHARRNLTEVSEQYSQVREAAIIIVDEYTMYEETLFLFCEMSSMPCSAVLPEDQYIKDIKKGIVSCDKLINQGDEAYSRWQGMVQTMRQLQNNVYKGLSEYEHILEKHKEKLKDWNHSLTEEFWEVCDYVEKKMNSIALMTLKLRKVMANQFNEGDSD